MGSRGRESKLNYLILMFFKGGMGRDLEGFGGVLTTSNPSFLIPSKFERFEERVEYRNT